MNNLKLIGFLTMSSKTKTAVFLAVATSISLNVGTVLGQGVLSPSQGTNATTSPTASVEHLKKAAAEAAGKKDWQAADELATLSSANAFG
jgi:hypothetical protein